MERNAQLIEKMIAWEKGCPARAGHFLKVLGYAYVIAEGEGADKETVDTVTAAAIVHDIGIRPSLEKYGSDDGKHQEAEGPVPARRMLQECGFPKAMTERVAELVGMHHTYSPITGLDHQILIEADLLVNLEEGGTARPKDAPHTFQTQTGRKIYEELFGFQSGDWRAAASVSS